MQHLHLTLCFEQVKQAEPPDCHICKFLPSGNLVIFPSSVQARVLLHEAPAVLVASVLHSSPHLVPCWSDGSLFWNTKLSISGSKIIRCKNKILYKFALLLQVCFGNMQHEIVVYTYKGPGQGASGEVAEMPYEDGLPFSRYPWLFPLLAQNICQCPLTHP